jgi:hypothetical protein
MMTVRELIKALQALPEDWQDLQVFSTADYDIVRVGGVANKLYRTMEGQQYVELEGE